MAPQLACVWVILAVHLFGMRDSQGIGKAHFGCVCEGASRDDCHASQPTEVGKPPLNIGAMVQWAGGSGGREAGGRKK